MAYDISDARRLRHVAKVMKVYRYRLRYSVLLCDLSGMERVGWEADIRDELNLAEDSVVRIDLGPGLARSRICQEASGLTAR
jgi:CRISPR-associated protein Cas2